jgi:hypothetical protein
MANNEWESITTVTDERWETVATKKPVVDPLTEETNKAALEAIGSAIPEPVKEAASAVGETVQAGWEKLPEPVKAPLRSTGNFLLDALDYINRPFQAVAVGGKQVLQAAGEEKPTDVFELSVLNKVADIGKALQRKEVRTAAVEGAERGFTGQERASTQELLSDEFRKANPVKSAVIGFAGDAVIDPLKASVVAAPFKVAKSAINAIPGSTTIATRLTDNELFRAFVMSPLASVNVTFGDVDKARNLYNSYRYLRDKAKFEGVRDAKQLNKQIKTLSKKSGIPVNELKAKLVYDIETEDLGSGEIGLLEKQIVDRNRQLLEEQRAAGVTIGDLGESYMPHLRSEDADDILRKSNSKIRNFFGIRPSAKSPSALKRQIEGTVEEINAKNIYGTTKFFVDDPAIMLGTAEFRAANAIAGRKFLTDVKELGVDAKNAPSNFVTIPEVPDVKFDPAVAKLVNRSYRALTDQEEIRKLLQVYDGATNWWKMWSLGVRPAYHAKNVVGNVWNNYLGGLDNPVRYGQATIFQNKVASNKLEGNIAGKPVQELYDEMSKRGVFGEGQYGGAEFSRVLEREIGDGKPITGPFKPVKQAVKAVGSVLTPSTRNVALRFGFKVGQTLEDNARIALFLDQVVKGKNYDQAGKHVQKYLFDYGDVSPFEQSVLKRAMPFYTWSRKNIPLQLQAIVEHPDKLSKLGLLTSNIQQAAGMQTIPDPSEVPEYLVERAPLYVGENQETGVVSAVALENLVPFFDLGPFTRFLNTPTVPKGLLESGPQGLLDAFLANANPYAKAILEGSTNYDTFRKRQIAEFEGQTADMLGVEMPVHLVKLLSNIVLLSELDRLNPGYIFGKREIDPATGEITQAPAVTGVTRESRMDLPEGQRTQLAGLTGIRIIDVNKGQEAINRAAQIERDIRAIDSKIRSGARNEKSRYFNQAEEAIDKFLDELDRLEQEARERMKESGRE